ncbi:NAD(P)-dependent oxidoreductase [Variovorax paradoxus]|nr:NAD(P)-dependent oxidoreductase [Variovorax paradoxus]MBT2304056.1 NAD(P)-dependent oxidoreductase [Variovorax paradoxus]
MTSRSNVIGMIGIGQLGLPIAINLIHAGYRVVGFRRSDLGAFVDAGGVALASPAEVVRQADVILLCLPGVDAQESVLAGPHGVLGALAPGKTVIELGTYPREFKLEQARRIGEAGARMLEAEVSGSPPMVAERRAALYVGGDAALVEACRPVLEGITAHHFHLGDIGSAVAMKLIANILVTVHILAAAEAMNLGTRAGFDPHRVAEVIRQGAGNSAMFTIRAPMMAARSFTPAPGPFKTLLKYLEMGSEMARDLDCSMPLFSTAVPYFMRGLEGGMAEEDAAAVIKLLELESGRATKHHTP